VKLTVTLSLISHTNVGKTTLVRTLLRRDVGEVLDQPHVTVENESFTLLETDDAVLMLWDTPGFGDTARLLSRLRREKDPIGWFLHQVWDRMLDRPLYCSQRALRNVRDEADVVLYLVNAAEDPETAGYVPLELELLGWLERPVLVLLNQVAIGAAEAEARWRTAMQAYPIVRDLLSLDAFTRSWVEEVTLLERIVGVLEGAQRAAMQRLAAEWRRRNEQVLRDACAAMGHYLAEAATDSAPVGPRAARGSAGTLGALRETLSRRTLDKRRAMTALNLRLDEATRRLMHRLIELHGLDGESARPIEQRIQDFQVRGLSLLDERSGALTGGLLSGLLGGLAADALAGGLTLGGGMIAGGILGALGGGALGRGYRMMGAEPAVRWAPPFLEQLTRQVLLRYLAVAHYGRGRGRYRDLEQPSRWISDVDQALAKRRDGLERLWSGADAEGDAARVRIASGAAERLEEALREILEVGAPDAPR
jgi:hypothetical protein